MSNSKKLEIPGSKSKHGRNRRLPPRRGQIKIKIFKELVKFLAPMAGGGARRPRENGAVPTWGFSWGLGTAPKLSLIAPDPSFSEN
ncbi:hypothetical protein C1H46_039462 [Malus baccata]|uniref:Uncharacterized protein n=1 Tax=Malus baccata TaxID=106549 RepID=A0A540KL92_MALBA|nr:hypothetical protein C1H46_039462 [Malus baccata]